MFPLSLEYHGWKDVGVLGLCWSHTGGLAVQDAGSIFASLHCSYHKAARWMELGTTSEGSLHRFENEMTQRHYQILSWHCSSVMEWKAVQSRRAHCLSPPCRSLLCVITVLFLVSIWVSSEIHGTAALFVLILSWTFFYDVC